MEAWVYHTFTIIILYAIWAIGMEILVKKYSNCACISLQTYIFAGIIASILFYHHIQKGCVHYKCVSDIMSAPRVLLIGLIIVSFVIIMANRTWIKAVSLSNSGFVSAVSSTYIVIVTLLSAYLFKTKVKPIQYLGIGLIVGGCYLLAK
jgi:drug/metabolite transporter (DMT)-like permease